MIYSSETTSGNIAMLSEPVGVSLFAKKDKRNGYST